MSDNQTLKKRGGDHDANLHNNLLCNLTRSGPSRLTLPTVPDSKTTSLNSLTIWPGWKVPREPPLLPEGQVL